MTLKHKIYFFFWKLYIRLKGIRVGTIVKVWSEDKNRYIKGCVTTISGDSFTKDNFAFYMGINMFEPLQGKLALYYSWGAYYLKEFKYNPIDKFYYINYVAEKN